MTHDAHHEREFSFESIAAAASEALFLEYGVAVRRNAEVDAQINGGFHVCGVIGFSGRHVRGTLVVALTEPMARRLTPIGGTAQLRDWTGELSNQLLGRIKLELLRRGVEIYLNLPAVLRGEHIAPLPRKALRPVIFDSDDGMAGIWIEVATDPGFQPAATDPNMGVRSGDTLIFE